MTIGRMSTAMMYENASSSISSASSALYNLQSQISSGKRVNVPSDDPVAAAQASIVKDRKAMNDSYLSGIGVVETQVSQSLTEVSNSIGSIQGLMELAVQARNGSLTPADLQSLGNSAQNYLDQMVASANAKDGQGNYLFSGTRTQTQPYALNSSGTYDYSGDQTSIYVRTSSSGVSQTGWSGVALFQSAKQGDGVVAGSAASTNKGNAFISESRTTTPKSYDANTYTISYAKDATSGKLMQTVTDASSNIVTGPTAYTPTMTTSFGGASVQMEGVPQEGDSFTIGPAKRVNTLDAASQLVNLLKNAPGMSASDLANGLAQASVNLSNGMDSMMSVQSLMGSELKGMDDQKTAIKNNSVQLESQRSDLEDLDYAKALSDLAQQKTALSASMQTFTSISSLSLFNYIK